MTTGVPDPHRGAPGPGGSPDPHREERFAHDHSADTGGTLFSTRGGGGDRLAEAVALMTRIRRDGRWESEQTHESLLPYLLEESWELVDAVADGDRAELVSELGDLLLQVLFHSAIAAEHPDEPFDVQDVAGALLDKLRRRAPYWFTDDHADDGSPSAADGPGTADGPGAAEGGAPAAHLDSAEQDRVWQQAKAAERAGGAPRGVVDGISWDQPALALGQKVLGRARSAGLPDDLVPEEMRLVRVDPVGVFHESGSAEVAYRQAVRRFADRLRQAEARLTVPADEATAADWHAAWDG